MLGREVELDMTLVRVAPYRLVDTRASSPACLLRGNGATFGESVDAAFLPDRGRVPAATRVAAPF
jgi:hypothetical protein